MTERAGTGESSDELAWHWHDNLIYGVKFNIGDPEKQEWHSDLIFDIDFIVEWLCEPSGAFRFRVAPATLVFHQVGDLSLAIDHGDSGGRNGLTEWAINCVTRDRLDRPFDYWRWTIALSMPSGGAIAFCSSGFTQTLRSEPVLSLDQCLPRAERRSP
jgi:hypothetical protein